MRFQKQKILLACYLFLVLFTFSLAPRPTLAAGLVPCGGYSTASTNPCTFKDIFVLIAQVTNWLVAVAALYAVYEIINNGFWLVMSMGNEESITKRKSGLSSAIV